MRSVVLGMLIVGAVIAAGVSTASARNFSVTSETGFRVHYGPWEVEFHYGETLVLMRCPVTLEGSFHSRSIAKVVGTLIGYVTSAVTAEASCRNAVGPRGESEWAGVRSRFLSETLPWHMRYNGFSGLLPAIAAVRLTLTGLAVRMTELPLAGSCLFRASATTPMGYALALGAAGEVTSFNSEGSLVPLSEGSGFCSRELAVAGDGLITQATSTSRLTVRLI